MTEPFEGPLKVAELLAGFSRPWFVAGGWAIDLYLNRVTRAHKDIEIAIIRSDQQALREQLKGWHFYKAMRGQGLEPWPDGERLELPIHEIHARHPTGDPPRLPSTLEILLNEADGDLWRFRRNLAVTRPLPKMGLSSKQGVPILSPEIVLLYKAPAPRLFDEADFANTRDSLDAERRSWLRDALGLCHPGHPWLARLDDG